MRFSLIPKILMYMSMFMCGSAIMTPLWGHYVFAIHGTMKTAGIAIGCYSLSYAISTPITSYIVTRLDRLRESIAVSYLLFGIFAIGYFFVDSPTGLYIVQVLLGFAYSIQSAAYDTLFGFLIEEGKESFAWGSYSMIYGFAVAFGALIGSHLVHYMGYDIVFGIISGFALVAFFIAIIIPHPKISLKDSANQ